MRQNTATERLDLLEVETEWEWGERERERLCDERKCILELPSGTFLLSLASNTSDRSVCVRAETGVSEKVALLFLQQLRGNTE